MKNQIQLMNSQTNPKDMAGSFICKMKSKDQKICMALQALIMLVWLAGAGYSHAEVGNWTKAANLPQPAVGPALAVANGLLYAVGGGTGPCSSSSSVFAYDPNLNSWSQKASLASGPLDVIALASLNGTLYAIGGGDGCTSTGVKSVQAYNPAQNSWDFKNNFPFDVRNAAAVVANGILYVLGAQTDGNNETNTVFAYNATSDTWTLVSTIPALYGNISCTVFSNIIYVIGGTDYSSGQAVNTHAFLAFNPATGIWRTNAPLPFEESWPNFSTATLNGLIYYTGAGGIGANPSGGNTNLVQVYNPQSNSWSYGMPLPEILQGASCAALNGKLYVVGGEIYDQANPDANVILNSTYVFTPPPPALNNIVVSPANPIVGTGSSESLTATGYYSDGSTQTLTNNGFGSWSAIAGMPGGKAGAAAACLNGNFFVLAGDSSSGNDPEIFAYNPTSGQWSGGQTVPNPFCYAGAFGISTNLYFFGGAGNCYSGNTGTELYIYNGFSWATGSSMPIGVLQAGADVLNGEIYVAGGSSGMTDVEQNTLQVYDPSTGIWTTKKPLPAARGLCGAAAINGKLYVAGGSDNTGATLQSLLVYDPATDSWRTNSPMPIPLTAVGATSVGGLLYVIGGQYAPDDPTNLVEVYNPVTDSWSIGAPTLTAHYLPRPVVINGTIYLAGNGPNNSEITNAECCTPQTVLWSSSNTNVATINNTNGLVTGMAPGTAVITVIQGSIISSNLLTVVTPPTITANPVGETAAAGGSVTLSVTASGGDLGYQWNFNGTAIFGATSASYVINNFAPGDIGDYSVTVSNPAGSVTSRSVTLASVGISLFAGVIVNGPLGSNYLIQSSPTLVTNWTTLTNVALPTQPYIYIDYTSPTNRQQFYRALPQ